MTETLRVEAIGETVAEARENARRELELLAPALDPAGVDYEVLSPGKRGLLGVGSEPARVAASAPRPEGVARRVHSEGTADPEERLREFVERVSAALGVRCRVEVEEADGVLTATAVGDDLGRLIGRHGQTLDALQVLAGAIVQRGREERATVVVDAAGYRARRARRIEEIALDAAHEATARRERVELEPMSAAERKLVHTVLADVPGIVTSSAGAEPNRYVVVEPG